MDAQWRLVDSCVCWNVYAVLLILVFLLETPLPLIVFKLGLTESAEPIKIMCCTCAYLQEILD